MRLFTILVLAAWLVAGLFAPAGAQTPPIEGELALITPVSKFIHDAALKAFADYAKEKWNVTVKVSAIPAGTPVAYGRIVEWKGRPEVEGSGGGDEYVDPVAVWATEDASPSGLTYWDGSLWMAGLRGERLWEIPVDDTDVGTPVPHLAGELGRLRTVESNADGSGLLLATSNTDGRGEPRDGDDRILAVTR